MLNRSNPKPSGKGFDGRFKARDVPSDVEQSALFQCCLKQTAKGHCLALMSLDDGDHHAALQNLRSCLPSIFRVGRPPRGCLLDYC